MENIHKLVSLTFDENPRVRLAAAAKLADVDDPAAIFALMELSYDKDPEVKKFAHIVLDKKKSNEREVMDLAEIFAPPTQAADLTESMEQKKAKILSPITQLFEKKLGKHRADQVKSKMMPTIEKVYMKSTQHKDTENGKKAIQEFLTSYLDAISDLDSIASDQHRVEDIHAFHTEEVEESTHSITDIELQERKELKEEETFETLPNTVFKKAYDTMLASNGNEALMRRELKRTLRELEHEAKLAYHLAKHRFKETNVTHISKIKNGMRNVNTELLTVSEVANREYKKGREKKLLTRVLVKDENGNEGVIYLFDNRGTWLKEGMYIKIVKGYVKTFSGETAITISTKGNIYIIL
ncbi:hypothetical protein J4450_08205 [Candidatus Micrarchaeota archaeon]|nr:hypothetical protein [Candidatus Micrarchaeota archaeon]